MAKSCCSSSEAISSWFYVKNGGLRVGGVIPLLCYLRRLSAATYIIPNLFGPSPGQHSSGESLQPYSGVAFLLQILPNQVTPQLHKSIGRHMTKLQDSFHFPTKVSAARGAFSGTHMPLNGDGCCLLPQVLRSQLLTTDL